MKVLVRELALAVLLALAATTPGWGQVAGTASVTGRVTDPADAVIPGAEVKATHDATGVARTVKTDAAGKYLLSQLTPGTYTIEVKMGGFKTAVNERIELLVGATTTLNVQLVIGGVTEQVVVLAGARGLNTSDASLGNTLSGTEIHGLPSLDLNPIGLLSLQPGVTYVPGQSDTIGGYGGITDRDGRGGSVNGARSDQTNVTLDGVDVNDPITGYAFNSVLRVTQASLQSVHTATTNYGAEAGGRSSAAQVQLVTKSGTNEIHGEVYYAHRNEALNANDFFLNRAGVKESRFRRHLFGAALGGPIVKDRFFLFGNWERLEESLSESEERAVPSTAFRDGVFFYECRDLAGFAPCVPPVGGFVTGVSGTQYGMDNQTGVPCRASDTNCGPIPGGFYALNPAEITAIDPLGLGPNPAILAHNAGFPDPNSTGAFDALNVLGFRFAAPLENKFNTYIIKADFNVNQQGEHRLYWRGTLMDDVNNSDPQFPGQRARQKTLIASKGFALGYTATFTPQVTNRFVWGVTRIKEATGGLRDRSFVDFSFIDNLEDYTSNSSGRTIPQHHFRDDLTWTRGRHTFSFGGEIRYTRNRKFTNANSFHMFSINPSWILAGASEIEPGSRLCNRPACFAVPANASGRSFRDALPQMLGPISQVTALYNFDRTGVTQPQGEAVRRKFAVDEYELYFQDQWRATPTLTLTFGVRYFLSSPPWEQNGNQVVPTPSISDWFECRQIAMLDGRPTSDCGLITIDLGGPANDAPGYYHWDTNNFSPRVAFAWAPRSLGWFSGDGKLVIRGGYSLVYDRIGNGLATSFDEEQPFNTFQGVGSFGLASVVSNFRGSCAIGTLFGRPPCVRFSSVFDTTAATAQSLQPPPGGRFPPTPPEGLLTITSTIDDSLTTPYSHTVNFSVGRELSGDLTIETSYVGRRGIRLPMIRDFGMPADLVDSASGVSIFEAARQLIGLSAAGQDILTLAPIDFWERLFPGFGPAGVNGGCLGFDVFGVDPAFNCGFSSTQVAYDYVIGHHGTGGAGDITQVSTGLGATSAWADWDYFGFPAYFSCSTGTDLDGDGFLDCPNAFFPSQYATLTGWTNLARSEYHALQLTVRKRMSYGLLFSGNYTLSHSLDHSSTPERAPVRIGFFNGGLSGSTINTWRPDLEYSNSDFDMRHQFNGHWIYKLPFGHGQVFGNGLPNWANQIIAGWTVSGIFRANSGLPVNVINARTWPTNWNLQGNATCATPGGHPLGLQVGPCPSTQNVHNSTRGTPNLFADPDEAIQHFRFGAPGERGQRNVLRGDKYINLDLGIARTFNMPWEGDQLEFRWDMFNLTNSVYFDGAPARSLSLDIGSPGTFGDYQQILGAPRRMQLSLRYNF